MAPKLTLTYFPFPAVAEQIRWALALSGLEWEDKRITKEEFGAVKPTLPYNQLPILEVDGVVIPQSTAQLRYVGKLGDLYPTDAIQAAFADAAVEAVGDHHTQLRPTMFAAEEEKAALRKEMTENFLPRWLGNLEKMLKSAGGEYFAGNKLSIGDIAVVCRLVWMKKGVLDGIPATIVDDYPLLTSLVERVSSEPKIVAYQNALLEKK
ncbi:unnamed protein product [Sphacelaria rigidula]